MKIGYKMVILINPLLSEAKLDDCFNQNNFEELINFTNNMPGIMYCKNKAGTYLWHNNNTTKI